MNTYFRTTVGLLIGFLLVLGLVVPLQARGDATITVSSALDVLDSEDGVCTLREAITAANDDAPSGNVVGECEAGSGEDTILVSTGTYTLTIEGGSEDENLTGDLDIGSSLTISATGAVTVNANQIDRAFDVLMSGNVITLRGLTITGGVALIDGANQGGGAIQAYGDLHLENCRIVGNRDMGIAMFGRLYISDSEIMSNTSQFEGGGLYVVGGVMVGSTTFANNSAASDGGAIVVHSMFNSSFFDSVFENNYSGRDGGAIAVFPTSSLGEESIVILGGSFVNNRAAGAGGAVSAEAATVTIGYATFQQNHAARGGALALNANSFIRYVTVQGNSADELGGSGGGLYFTGPSATIEASTFSENNATFGVGGGIYTESDLTLQRSTLSQNNAINGGGLYSLQNDITIIDSTVAENTAASPFSWFAYGGGLYLETDDGIRTITNSIVADNVVDGFANDIWGGVNVSSYLFLEDPNGSTPQGEGNIYGQDPHLLPLGDYGGFTDTYMPDNNSPVLDAGNCAANVDQRGVMRPIDLVLPNAANGCDMGSVEVQSVVATPTNTPPATVTTTATSTSTATATTTASPTIPATHTATPSPTATSTASPTAGATTTPTATASATITPTATGTLVATGTPTVTRTPTTTATITPTPLPPTETRYLYLPVVMR